MDLNGARTIIFGATGALGGLIAQELSERGAKLVVSGRDAEKLSVVAERVGATSSLPADLSDPNEASAVIGLGTASLGGLDAMVYAAGVVAFGPAGDLSPQVLNQLTAVNLAAPIIATSAALGEMKDGGTIVSISGIVAEQPTAGLAAYSATKGGLMAFNAAVGRESRRAGIRILDARPPHLATGLDGRPIEGVAPKLPEGRSPESAVTAIVDAMAGDDREITWHFDA